MLDELPATSCVSGTMKVSEHKAMPVIFQFVDVSLIDAMRDCLTGGIEPRGLLRKSAGVAPRARGVGQGWTAELRGGQKPSGTRVSTRMHKHPTCRDVLPNTRR